jgi:hypothetical protein
VSGLVRDYDCDYLWTGTTTPYMYCIYCCVYIFFHLDHLLVDCLPSTYHTMFATRHSVMADDQTAGLVLGSLVVVMFHSHHILITESEV